MYSDVGMKVVIGFNHILSLHAKLTIITVLLWSQYNLQRNDTGIACILSFAVLNQLWETFNT